MRITPANVVQALGAAVVAIGIYAYCTSSATPTTSNPPPKTIDSLVCGNALSTERPSTCSAPEYLLQVLDKATPYARWFPSETSEAQHFCHGETLYFVPLGQQGALLCTPNRGDWEYVPASLHFEGLQSRASKDALGRPVYYGTVTPLDRNGQPSK